MARTIGSSGPQTARRVRDQALILFARQGYAAVSMRQIADQAGLQAGALYNHFQNKQEILVELLASHMRGLIAAWELQSREFSSPLDAIEGFVRFHIRYHLDKQDAVFISYMELRNLTPDNFKAIEAHRRVYEGFLRKIISSGVEQRQFSVIDVPVAAMAILAMLTGLNSWYRTGGRLDVDQLEEIYVNMTRGSIGLPIARTNAYSDI